MAENNGTNDNNSFNARRLAEIRDEFNARLDMLVSAVRAGEQLRAVDAMAVKGMFEQTQREMHNIAGVLSNTAHSINMLSAAVSEMQAKLDRLAERG